MSLAQIADVSVITYISVLACCHHEIFIIALIRLFLFP